MATGYTAPDYRDTDDIFGQDWTGNMTIRGDTLAVAVGTIVTRIDNQSTTDADLQVDQFQIIPGTNGCRTAFRVTDSGLQGVAYKVTLQVLTINGVTLFRSVQIPATTG